jgi:hypothetical protein
MVVVIWYISPRFGKLCQEKSGKPDAHTCKRAWLESVAWPALSDSWEMVSVESKLFETNHDSLLLIKVRMYIQKEKILLLNLPASQKD